MRRLIAAALIIVTSVVTLPPSIGIAKERPRGAKVVGTDPAGDWGQQVNPDLGEVGDVLGQDLVKATIAMDGADTVNFVIELTSLPAWGGWPEISRYTWDFYVNREFTELDGKFANYSRGLCDPTSGQCPPPRDPGLQPFLVRGDCQMIDAVHTCQELGIVQATFDPTTATITIPVPLELIDAGPGSKIESASNIYGGSISATPSTFFSTDGLPLDTLNVNRTFVVPRSK